MPIYEYKCDDCGKITEFLANKPAKKPGPCRHCNSENLKKALSTFSQGSPQGNSKKCHGCTDYKCPHAGM